jgi:hypothetical protein
VSRVATSGGVLAHIRHAEQWLRRARTDYVRGDACQAVLRLLLAEAEIRRARESGAATAAVPRARFIVPSWAVLGAAVAAGIILAVHALTRPLLPGPSATVPSVIRAAPAGERLDGRVLRFESGQILPFVGLPAGGRPIMWPGSEGIVAADGDSLRLDVDGPAPVTLR